MMFKKTRSILFIIVALSVLFFQLPLNADPEVKAQTVESKTNSNTELREKKQEDVVQELEMLITEEEELPQEIDSYIRYMPSVGVSSMSGKISLVRAVSEYSYTLRAFDKLPIELFFNTHYIGIKDNVEVPLPAHLTGLAFGTEVTLPFFNLKDVYWRNGVYPSFYGEEWDCNSSNFRIPLRSFLIYKPSQKWIYVLGVAVYPSYEDKIFPIAGFIYKPNDKLIFNMVPERFNITYMMNNRLGFFGEFNIYSDEFEVKFKDIKNVVLKYKERSLGVGTIYKFNKFIKTSFSVGGAFSRTFKYKESLGKVHIEDSLYTEFRLEMAI